MKKLFTLLVSMGILGAVSAQHGGYENQKPVQSNDQHRSVAYSKTESVNTRERDAQLQKINREFDQKIQYVNRDRRLRPAQKNRQVSMLERERKQEIKEVMARYSASKNSRYDDGLAKNHRQY